MKETYITRPEDVIIGPSGPHHTYSEGELLQLSGQQNLRWHQREQDLVRQAMFAFKYNGLAGDQPNKEETLAYILKHHNYDMMRPSIQKLWKKKVLELMARIRAKLAKDGWQFEDEKGWYKHNSRTGEELLPSDVYPEVEPPTGSDIPLAPSTTESEKHLKDLLDEFGAKNYPVLVQLTTDALRKHCPKTSEKVVRRATSPIDLTRAFKRTRF